MEEINERWRAMEERLQQTIKIQEETVKMHVSISQMYDQILAHGVSTVPANDDGPPSKLQEELNQVRNRLQDMTNNARGENDRNHMWFFSQFTSLVIIFGVVAYFFSMDTSVQEGVVIFAIQFIGWLVLSLFCALMFVCGRMLHDKCRRSRHKTVESFSAVETETNL